MKKLYRSNTNKILAGVFGGVGEYFDVDPTLLRLAYVLLSIVTGHLVPSVIGYVIAIIIIPKKYIHHIEHTEHHKS